MRVAHHSPMQSLDPFAAIVRRHQSAVCAAAFGVTGDRALSEDIAQETFLVAWRSLSTLRDPSKLGGWLRGIARNLAHKARPRRGMASLEDCGDLAASGDPARDAVEQNSARLVWAALRGLPEGYREVLVLYYWEDQSARRVAESLGISEAAAMQRLSRGRALLRGEVQRLVDGTLRRARPGAALTAAVLAAIAATTAKPVAAASAGDPSLPGGLTGGDVSRRMLGKAGLAFAGLSLLGAFDSLRAAIATLSSAPPGRGSKLPTAQAVSPSGSRDAPSAPRFAGVPDGASDSSPERAPRAHAPPVPGDGADEEFGDPMSVSVTSGEGSASWAVAALSLCFVDELVDQPCRIDVEVLGGKIAGVAVAPFEGASHRVVVRTLQDVPTTLAPPDLVAWLAAGKLIRAVRDEPRLADHGRAMEVGEFVGLCAKARLEGLPVPGPDGTRPLWFSWVRDAPRRVDRQAYVDLGVEAGASRGPASAPVAIVSFLDVADPWGFGGKSVAAWSQVLARYPDDVRLVIKLCPLAPERALAAEAIYAAGAQGAFWPMLELVASAPERVALEDLVGHAATLGLDSSRFRDDLERRTFRDAVELDQDQRVAMDIDGLPHALVNGKRVHGALPGDTCLRIVEKALRARVAWAR